MFRFGLDKRECSSGRRANSVDGVLRCVAFKYNGSETDRAELGTAPAFVDSES